MARISANPDDPGFKWKGRTGYRVLMDGRPLERAVRVDTCAGVAWVADTDRDGNIRIDRKKGEVILRRVLGPMRVQELGNE